MWGLGPGQGAESVLAALSCGNAAKPVQPQLLDSELRKLDSTKIGSPCLGWPGSEHFPIVSLLFWVLFTVLRTLHLCSKSRLLK